MVLSHFHADDPAGLRDFPNARILYKRDAHTAIKDLGLLASVKAGSVCLVCCRTISRNDPHSLMRLQCAGYLGFSVRDGL